MYRNNEMFRNQSEDRRQTDGVMIWWWLGWILMVSGLTSPGPPGAPSAQMARLYEAFNRFDAEGVADLMADDGVYEDLLLGETTICRGKAMLTKALRWHPAFLLQDLIDVRVVVDDYACDGHERVGVEWHVQISDQRLPLGRGLTHARIDPETGKLLRVVDICEAPWRVVGLLFVRPVLLIFRSGLLFVLLGLDVLLRIGGLVDDPTGVL